MSGKEDGQENGQENDRDNSLPEQSSSRPWLRQLVTGVAVLIFLAPAVVMAVAVVQKARQAQPFVDELILDAEAFGGEVTPQSMFDVDGAPADVKRPPGAQEQSALVDKGFQFFNGDPVDGDLFHPITIWLGSIVITLWALGALVFVLLSKAPAVVVSLATLASIGALWLPLIRYRQIIDVVGYYVC